MYTWILVSYRQLTIKNTYFKSLRTKTIKNKEIITNITIEKKKQTITSNLNLYLLNYVEKKRWRLPCLAFFESQVPFKNMITLRALPKVFFRIKLIKE